MSLDPEKEAMRARDEICTYPLMDPRNAGRGTSIEFLQNLIEFLQMEIECMNDDEEEEFG